jgi:hypothetical protein
LSEWFGGAAEANLLQIFRAVTQLSALTSMFITRDINPTL